MNIPKNITLTCEANHKKITLELPRDSDAYDMVEMFNQILSFQWFMFPLHEILKDQIIDEYEMEKQEEAQEVLLSNVINNDSWQII